MYADGNVSNGKSFSISLQEEDKHILYSFLRELKTERKLIYYERSKQNPNWKNIYKLCISNMNIYSKLVLWGVVPQKSLILKFPIFLRDDLIPHFIRGYFDGDGCFYYSKIKSKDVRVSIISTQDFCESLKNIIENNIGVHCSISFCRDKSKSTRCLQIGGNLQCKKFLDYIYKDANLFLYRKYNKYQEKYFS